MKQKTLIIHIGFAKTGTTSIQLFCQHNRATLEQYGVHYLQSGLIWCIHRDYANSIEAIAKEINDSKNKTYILSEEELSFKLDYKSIGDILQKTISCEVKFLCYVRPQDEFFESLYREDIKNTRIAEPPKYYLNLKEGNGTKLNRGDYLSVIEYYKTALSLRRSDFIVRHYSKDKMFARNLLKDFLFASQTQISTKTLTEKSLPDLGFDVTPNLNLSASNLNIERKRRINQLLNRAPLPPKIKNTIAHIAKNKLFSQKKSDLRKKNKEYLFTDTDRIMIKENFKHHNAELKKDYGIEL